MTTVGRHIEQLFLLLLLLFQPEALLYNAERDLLAIATFLIGR